MFLSVVTFNVINVIKPLDINEPLGMQNGEIVDTQISSSSSIDEAHAASRGRLHLNATSGKAGAWSAGRNDNSQWLQVDLRNNNVRVTGVATQGRNGRYAQWVTNYKLQYSNDGVNFQFYKKPEHTALEVCTKSIQLPTFNVPYSFF